MHTVTLQQASWHVVYTKPRQEFRAREELQNQGYTCFLPTFAKQRIRKAIIEEVVEPMFSRYLFIQLDILRGRCTSVQNTRGVSRIVAFGGQFATVPETFIEALRLCPQQVGEKIFSAGERVVIQDGPFTGQQGVYCSASSESRALILIELLSSPQKLEFALNNLRKAA